MEFPDKEMNIEEVREAIAASSNESSIYIGADSKQFTKNKVKYVCYVTVVVIHIDTLRGGKIFKSYKTERDYGSLRQRLMTEVGFAINIGYELIDDVGVRPFQIHLDLNPDPKHKSHVVVKEATGYVLGMLGFKPKLKPDAFAASSVSDRWAVKGADKRKRSS